MSLTSKSALLIAALCIAGCGERPQTLGSSPAKKSDTKAWDGAPGAYGAAGWQGGDQAAWEAQLRNRAQGQTEYSRAAVTAQAAPTKAP
jgi:hypothetical protein